MNIAGISSINFMSKIIDSHAHVGRHDGELYHKSDLDVFIKSTLSNNDTVEKIIVSDLSVLHSLQGEYEGNKALAELFKNNPKYSILASCNPKDGNVKNIEKLFKEYPNTFMGLKFHSSIQQLDLSDKKYEPYMEFASKNKLPCLFHSQVNTLPDGKINPAVKHIADPENIYSLAKKYPKPPVVMAHLGAGWKESHDKAIDILVESIKKGDANLYADISWVDIDEPQEHIVKALKRLKGIGEKDWKYGDQAFRLMFGSDAPLARFKGKDALNIYTDFIERIKNSIRNDNNLKPEADKIIDDLFYNNSQKLYLSPKTNSSKNKFLIIGAVMCLVGIIGYFANKIKQKESKTGFLYSKETAKLG